MTAQSSKHQSEGGPARRVLSLPFIGFAPWILLAVVEGPGRVPLAAGLACALAIAIAITGVAVGMRPRLLEVTGIAFFALTLTVVLAAPETQPWLGGWAAEISNIAVAVVTVGSILARRPFTLPYARQTTEPEHWHSALFLRINYAMSAAWAIAFAASAIVGYIGDGPLHDPHNIWTNWVLQIVLVIAAIKFCDWYPDKAIAKHTPQPGIAPA